MRKVLGAGLALFCISAVPYTPLTKQSNIGDSISQGFGANGFPGDHPRLSWAQGTDDGVRSVYERQTVLYAGFDQEPESVTGAELIGGDDNFPAQASRVCAQDRVPDQVFVLLGGNDVCNRGRSNNSNATANMYSNDTWRAYLRAGIDQLVSCMPTHGVVQVMSMPRVDYLYEAGRDKSLWCSWGIWPIAGVCRIVTAEGNATRRAQIGARIDAYNDIIREEVAAYGANTNRKNSQGLRFVTDWVGSIASGQRNTSVGTFRFSANDINGVDCFHPNVGGQAKLACLGWAVNPGGDGDRASCF